MTGLVKMDFRKLVTKALPYRSLWGYRQATRYFGEAETLLANVIDGYGHLSADERVELVDYALLRLEKALQTVDDSGGYRLTLEYDLQEQHVFGVSELDWEPDKFVDYFVDLFFSSSDLSDRYGDFPLDYLKVLDAETLVTLEQRMQAEWDGLEGPTPDLDEGWDKLRHYSCVQETLEQLAESRGDTEKVIAVKEKGAPYHGDFLELAVLHTQNQNYEQADKWIAKARRDGTNPKIDRAVIALEEARGEIAHAVSLQWALFDKTLGVADYQRLVELDSLAPDGTDWCARAENRITQQVEEPGSYRGSYRPVAELVSFYLHIDQANTAATVALSYPGDLHTSALIDLAERVAPPANIGLHFDAAEQFIDLKNRQNYNKAVRQLAKLAKNLEPKHQQVFDRKLAQLKETHRLKRTLIEIINHKLPKS